MVRLRLAFTAIYFLFVVQIFSQEIEKPLEFNYFLQNYKPADSKITKESHYRGSSPFNLDSIEFFDDFSANSVFPDNKFWIDSNVFINTYSAWKSPSLGVATFDGLNRHGMPYNPGELNSRGEIADILTSVPINLSTYQESDSLFLSFFYQPQGMGDMPESFDSLVLEFKPDSLWNGNNWDKTKWYRVWSVTGSSRKPFTQIIIHIPKEIKDTTGKRIASFYTGDFQFRFANYGNRSGNLDHWHLDYVKLNKNRRVNDVYYNDIAVVDRPQSLLISYLSVPWDHFLLMNNEQRTSSVYHAQNLMNSAKTLKKIGYRVIDTIDGQKVMFNDSAQAGNIRALSDSLYNISWNSSQFSTFKTKPQGDLAVFKSMIFSFSDYSDEQRENDTAWTYQVFSNYYAYDDGIPEAGYGIANSSFGQVAYKFQVPDYSSTGDSLRGVGFYFNQSKDQVSKRSFKILVWKEDLLEPVLTVDAYIDGFENTDDNGYLIYQFDSAIYIDGTFYIGWQQNADFYMNIGLDKNYYLITGDSSPDIANKNIYYNYNFPADWHQSSVSGALMIRPYISDKPIINATKEIIPPQKIVSVFPNPAGNYFMIKSPGSQIVKYELVDASGRKLLSGEAGDYQKVDLTNIENGFYFIRIFNENQVIQTEKLLINK